MKTHVIHWKSNENGKTGIGTLLFEKEEAELLAAELNGDFPHIEHQAVPCAPLVPEGVEIAAPEGSIVALPRVEPVA